jgi:hypothetical protein
MTSISTVDDLQLCLKLEKKDHEFTKKQLAEVEQEFSDFKDNQSTLISSKLAEIRNIHQVEREHLNNRL